jgi:hypothetical protein
MRDEQMLQLAQDLEWLGSEAGFLGKRNNGAAEEIFLEKQRAVLLTAAKLERELKSAVRFNLASLTGVDYSVEWSLNSVAELLTQLEDIKEAATGSSVHELPQKARQFTRMVHGYLGAAVPLVA